MTREELIRENKRLRRAVEQLESELYPRLTKRGIEEQYYNNPDNWIGWRNEDLIEVRRREQ